MPAIAATIEAWPAATIATLPAAIRPREVWTPVTRPPSMSMRGHLGALDEVDAERVRGPRVAPRDVVVLGDAATRLPRRAEDRVADVVRHVHDRAEALDVGRAQPLGVDAVEPVRVDPPLAFAHVAQVVGEVHHAALAEEQVVVELLGQRLPELERVLVDGRALVPQVVAADDRGVAGDVPAGQPAALHHGDVRDAVALREVVGGRQSVPAAADDHDVVGGLRVGMPPQPVGVRRRVTVGAVRAGRVHARRVARRSGRMDVSGLTGGPPP